MYSRSQRVEQNGKIVLADLTLFTMNGVVKTCTFPLYADITNISLANGTGRMIFYTGASGSGAKLKEVHA
jgi:hypothetical protein